MATLHTLTLKLSAAVARAAGTPMALGVAMVFALGSVAYGARVGFTREWALTFDVVTSLVPLLMVFILQSSQNRDGLALQAKLDELILRGDGANRMVGAEDKDERELRSLADSIRREASGDGAGTADGAGRTGAATGTG
jgi:low affinity Fe/Cu permease